MKKLAVIAALVGIWVIVLTGCATTQQHAAESWEHVISEGNFRQEEGFYMYKYQDERFNTRDWYDVWMDDSFWDTSLGWSRFVDVYDQEKGMFMYGLSFYEGYIEFPAYGKELVGATLRFYRLPVR